MPAARLQPLVVLALSLLGCAKPAPAPGRERVVIGVSLLRISQPVFVALEHGLFTAHGLDVQVERFDTAQPLADELAAGRLDAAGYVALPILFSREGRPPPVRIATAIVEDQQHPLSFLLVKKDSPLDSVAALKGKSVGILPTLAYRRWLLAILDAHQLAAADVTITPVAPPLEVDTLAGGGVDALFTGDPMASAALARGVARPLTDGAEVPRALGEPFVFGSFALSETLVRERPRAAKAIVEALDEAIAAIAADQQQGRQAMTAYLRDAERPFISSYPPTRYLPSRQVDTSRLEDALSRETAHPHAQDVLWSGG